MPFVITVVLASESFPFSSRGTDVGVHAAYCVFPEILWQDSWDTISQSVISAIQYRGLLVPLVFALILLLLVSDSGHPWAEDEVAVLGKSYVLYAVYLDPLAIQTVKYVCRQTMRLNYWRVHAAADRVHDL